MRRLPIIAFALLVGAAGLSARGGQAAPPLSVDDQLVFLRTADVVSTRPIGKGVTGALRVTLRDGQRTHDAAFQSVAQETTLEDRMAGRRRAGERNFVDHYRYNIAAWRLASALGLGSMMPATVERRVEGKTGALSWWVDDVLMDETERERTNVNPPSGLQHVRQRQRMDLFAELVRDTDRNKGNIIYTKSWQVVMLDFTRAFRLQHELRSPNALMQCDRTLLARLRALTPAAVAEAVGTSLTPDEVAAVMARRELIVNRFDALIAERGEALVLY